MKLWLLLWAICIVLCFVTQFDLVVSRELVLVLVLALLVLTTRLDVSPLDTTVNRNWEQHIFLGATINISQRRWGDLLPSYQWPLTYLIRLNRLAEASCHWPAPWGSSSSPSGRCRGTPLRCSGDGSWSRRSRSSSPAFPWHVARSPSREHPSSATAQTTSASCNSRADVLQTLPNWPSVLESLPFTYLR